MSVRDLQAFVALLEQRGRLRRIGARVSRDLEISEIADRVSKSPPEANAALLTLEALNGADLADRLDRHFARLRAAGRPEGSLRRSVELDVALGGDRVDALERFCRARALDRGHPLLETVLAGDPGTNGA